MFAGLPGIGVGTLFYVLAALWMPVREAVRLLRGDVCLKRWRLVVIQLAFAISIVASIAIADRVLALMLSDGSVQAVTPARLINEGFAVRAPESFWAAPVFASLLLLVGVLVLTEVARAVVLVASGRSTVTAVLFRYKPGIPAAAHGPTQLKAEKTPPPGRLVDLTGRMSR
jgi:hypothetical protein